MAIILLATIFANVVTLLQIGISFSLTKSQSSTSVDLYAFIAIMFTYALSGVVLIGVVACKNRRIRIKPFKGSKTQIYFIIVIITLTLFVSLYVILLLEDKKPEAYSVLTLCYLIQSIAVQVIIFSPVILSVVLEKHLPSLINKSS